MTTWETWLVAYLLIGVIRLGISVAWMVHAMRSRHPDYLKMCTMLHYAWETGAIAFTITLVGGLVGIVCIWGRLVLLWPICRWGWGTL